MMNNAILNDVFLNNLFKQTEREIYARITSLTQKEEAIEYIEGKVSGGSINVDGKSAIRRSCSLTLVAKDININEFYWGIKNKFKLEIGLLNQVEPNYDEIIWFPQGIFLITNFDTNYTTKNCQISIKGKDKMCLLNGEFGGHLPHNTDFGKEKYHDLETDTVTETDIPIATIVREAVRNFGDELPHNIIINDIEDAGLILLEYRGNTPMYMFRKINSDIFTNVTFNEKQKCYYINESGQLQSTTIGDSNNIIYDNLVDLEGEIEPTKIILSLKNVGQITDEEFYNGSFYTILKESYIDINGYQYKDLTDKEYISGDNIYKYAYIYDKNENYYQAQDEYYIAKFENGSTPGYRLTELTYAGDLISKVGETVVSVLDKIKKMLGDFEYFYNLDGKFVFQKQKNYNFSNWPSNELDEVIYNDSTLNMEKPIFNLLDNKLITSFKNSPKITDLRNDYSVWGSRKTDSGTERTLHARYAIDIKPEYYKTFDSKIYTTKEELFIKSKEDLKEIAKENVKKEILNFKPKHQLHPILTAPQMKYDGSWTPGWWDIRDWAEYYKMITNSKEDPLYTMKWYSQGDSTGYEAVTTRWGSNNNVSEKYVWLIIEDEKGNLSYGHGGCDYDKLKDSRKCTKYAFNWDKYYQGLSSYQAVTKLEETKVFPYPYAGCNDQHTYLSFLKYDVEKDDKKVYFYNPNFPTIDYDKLIENKIDDEFNDLIDKGMVNLVDWREIIYQMALDYRRHYHEDDFLYYLAQNNMDYYPSGVTGYERYYIDLEGFWRTLYNPNPEPKSKNISYLDASKHLSEDTLYISNSYRPLKEEERDEFVIDIEQLYILDYNAELTSYRDIEGFKNYPIPPDEIPPKTPELVSFLKSEYCCLHYNEDKTKCDDVYFYADSEGKVGDGTDDIKILNSLELSQIYIKERGPFITLEGYENLQEYKFVGKVTEENFNINKKVYWIKNEDEEYILATKWNKNQDYYIIYNAMQEEFKQLDLSELEDINIDEVENFNIRNYLTNEDIIKIYEDNYQWRKENLEGVFMSKYESEATQIIYTEKKIEYVNKIKKQLKIDTLNNFKWIKDDIENQYLYYEYEDNEIKENKISYDRIIRICSHEFGIEAIKSKYRELRLDIREKYYANNNGKELRSYYYVKGEVDPGDEWPSTDISNNNLFIIKKQNNDSKYQFWVFKYPIGTSINQYPGDYTNYAQKQLENYLNKYGWDKLLIKTNESLKFSELNQDVQRLYYKETGSIIEYFNLLQYNNFNELKTNKNELINNLPLIKPSSYLQMNDFISQVENFCKNYCNGLNNTARKKLEEIYKLNRNNFDTNEKYNETITSMYLEFIDYLESLYPKQLKYPAYDISRVQYQIVYYDFNNDSITGNYWTKLITESPEQLEFWFDFINGENSNLSKYSVPAIGPRTKVVNDKDVKAIYYKEVPNTIFITSQEEYKKYSHQTGYNYIQLPKEMESVFVTSSRGKSAQKAVEDLLYKHCYGTETATIQTVPIYHLQPNTCIYIRNNETNIDGDYLISKITVPLDHKKMMSITASKVMPRII